MPTIWMTGLSGSGKTTLARYLAQRLLHEGKRVQILDGDELRQSLSSDLGFSRADRIAHAHRVGYVAQLLSRHGIWVIVPLITPYESSRQDQRRLHEEAGCPFFEVYVSTSLSECERRDVKGLYARARTGGITGMTGIDDPYETPSHPDLTLDTQALTVEECIDQITSFLTTHPGASLW